MFFADVSKNDGPSTCSQTWNEPQVCSTLKSTSCCCNDSVLSVADLSVAGELKTIFENVQEALESTGAIEIHFPDVIPAIHIEDNEDGTNARNNTGANHPSSSSSSRLARSGKKVSSKKSRPNKRKRKTSQQTRRATKVTDTDQKVAKSARKTMQQTAMAVRTTPQGGGKLSKTSCRIARRK